MTRRVREQWAWNFLGFETPAGNPVTSYEINGLPQDAKDEFVDVLLHLQVRPNIEWAAEHFKPLEDGLSEIRFKTATHKYRIYGCFWGHQTYLMLVATDKKVSNQINAKQLAKSRRKQLQSGAARTHIFSIKE